MIFHLKNNLPSLAFDFVTYQTISRIALGGKNPLSPTFLQVINILQNHPLLLIYSNNPEFLRLIECDVIRSDRYAKWWQWIRLSISSLFVDKAKEATRCDLSEEGGKQMCWWNELQGVCYLRKIHFIDEIWFGINKLLISAQQLLHSSWVVGEVPEKVRCAFLGEWFREKRNPLVIQWSSLMGI